MLIVLVKFYVSEGFHQPFKDKLKQNALASLQEPHCHRFDLGEKYCEEKQQYEFVLYEEYNDQAAFDFHLTTPHFARFSSETAGMVSAKEIDFYQLIK